MVEFYTKLITLIPSLENSCVVNVSWFSKISTEGRREQGIEDLSSAFYNFGQKGLFDTGGTLQGPLLMDHQDLETTQACKSTA